MAHRPTYPSEPGMFGPVITSLFLISMPRDSPAEEHLKALISAYWTSTFLQLISALLIYLLILSKLISQQPVTQATSIPLFLSFFILGTAVQIYCVFSAYRNGYISAGDRPPPRTC
ncbi:hypothetical protein DL95DRAFT_457725 [Leptodontidium sp. 2 PMI_412]|nr:hypothetical protein DL95DRAFT_457725 [Leptodontidium sp. 2 PMI_412]